MQKITILTIIAFLLISCSGRNENQTMIEETGDIIEGYVDTLEGSIGDAKDVRKLIEGNQQDLKNNLDSIY